MAGAPGVACSLRDTGRAWLSGFLVLCCFWEPIGTSKPFELLTPSSWQLSLGGPVDSGHVC